MSAPDVEYKQRIVVFLDLLGVKDRIQRIVDPGHVGRIAQAFDTVREFTRSEGFWQDQQVSQFSDRVVVSNGADQRSACSIS